MCHANDEKYKTTHDRRNGTNKSRKIRALEENENYKYLGILEVNTIKQEMKEKLQKSLFGERGNYSKPNNIAEILSKR